MVEVTPSQELAYLQQVVGWANANNARMDGTLEPFREIIAAHDVVIGVWQDFKSPCGVATSIIKGIAVVQMAKATQRDLDCRMTALNVYGPEQSEALRQSFGDKDTLH